MYIANQSFIASNGKTYRMGDVIDAETYESFSKIEKAKCTEKKEKVSKSQKISRH